MPSPLFPNFNRFTQQQLQAMQKWLESQQQRPGSGSSGRGRGQGPRSGQPTQYGRGDAGPDWLWKAILSKLGPLGQIVDAMLRPQGKPLAPSVDKELQAAQQLLEAFGYFVEQGQRGHGGATGVGGPLRGELVKEDPSRPEYRIDSNPKPSRPEAEGVESPTLPRRRPRSDEPGSEAEGSSSGPLVEGMIPVRSSNVHSIGYEWNENSQRPGNLLVRYLGGTGSNRTGAGSLYRYFDVPREVFVHFKAAASKGKFVWDELRVRGSVAGHQFDYELAGTDSAGYVPRQAGMKRGAKGEFYMQRSFKGRRSQLPERQVRGTRGALTQDFRQKAQKIDFRAGRRS